MTNYDYSYRNCITSSSATLILLSSTLFIFSLFLRTKTTSNTIECDFFHLYIWCFYSWFRFRSHEDSSNDKNTIIETDRNKIHRILLEFGLDPRDYIFNSSQEQTSDQSSAFFKYSPTSITSGRPLTYAQQPPPNIDRQVSNDMTQQRPSSRRTPPPPPSPDYDSNTTDPNLSAEHYLRQINSQDNPPVKVVKQNSQNVVYNKEIRIRYLQPPTPSPPAPIIIREKHAPPNPPESVRKKIHQFYSLIIFSPFFIATSHSRKKTRTTDTTTFNYS